MDKFAGALAHEVHKAEKGMKLAREIILTLLMNIEKGHLPEGLRPAVEDWDRRLKQLT